MVYITIEYSTQYFIMYGSAADIKNAVQSVM